MPNGSDQRPTRNRRPRRRSQTSRLPVTEQDEVAELEAARERNDLDIRDLREMTVKELQEVGDRLDIDGAPAERRDDLVDQILQAQTERAGLDYAFGILDIVDEGYGFMRRHGLLPSPDDVYVSLEPGPPLRPPRSATASPAPSARRARARSTGA